MELIWQSPQFDPAFRWVAVVAAIGFVISALEHLADTHYYADKSLLSWQVFKYQGNWSMPGRSSEFYDRLFAQQSFRELLRIRSLVTILILILALADIWVPFLWLLLLLMTLAINLRSAFGLDGAFQMNLIIVTTLFLASLFARSALIQELCLAFITVQLILSYTIAGYWKLVSPSWRNGTALIGIFSTSMYGHPMMYEVLRSQTWLSRLLSWCIIGFEVSFPLVVLIPPPMVVGYLAIGVMFHAGTAVLMGLNGFFFAFVSAYPALLHFVSRS